MLQELRNALRDARSESALTRSKTKRVIFLTKRFILFCFLTERIILFYGSAIVLLDIYTKTLYDYVASML